MVDGSGHSGQEGVGPKLMVHKGSGFASLRDLGIFGVFEEDSRSLELRDVSGLFIRVFGGFRV